MTCLSAYMYRQISQCTDKSPKRHYWGEGAIAPLPPSGYANAPLRARNILHFEPEKTVSDTYILGKDY